MAMGHLGYHAGIPDRTAVCHTGQERIASYSDFEELCEQDDKSLARISFMEMLK